MAHPAKRQPQMTFPAITTGIDIEGQGHVPGPVQEDAKVEAAPKGEEKARGFGLMLRSQMYKVR